MHIQGFPIPEIWISGRFQVIVFDETLDGIDTYGCGKKSILYQSGVYLCGIHPWKLFLESIYLFDCSIGKSTGCTFVRTCTGHQGMVAAAAVAAYPENGDLMYDRPSTNKVDQFSGVIAVNRKRALCITYRTGFQFRPDKFHKTVK